jgi:cysteine synthase
MSILDSIGNTPMVELKRLKPNPKVRLMTKLEGNNPAGSVKDRTALYMITKADQ